MRSRLLVILAAGAMAALGGWNLGVEAEVPVDWTTMAGPVAQTPAADGLGLGDPAMIAMPGGSAGDLRFDGHDFLPKDSASGEGAPGEGSSFESGLLPGLYAGSLEPGGIWAMAGGHGTMIPVYDEGREDVSAVRAWARVWAPMAAGREFGQFNENGPFGWSLGERVFEEGNEDSGDTAWSGDGTSRMTATRRLAMVTALSDAVASLTVSAGAEYLGNVGFYTGLDAQFDGSLARSVSGIAEASEDETGGGASSASSAALSSAGSGFSFAMMTGRFALRAWVGLAVLAGAVGVWLGVRRVRGSKMARGSRGRGGRMAWQGR